MSHVRAAVVVAMTLSGCDVDLERMIDQPRRSTYEACDACPDGTVMMAPPAGTVPRHPAVTPAGGRRPDGGFVETIPIRVDRAVMARGRGRFDIFCAACHGRLGDGLSQVAENMTLRLPPSLVEAPYADYPPGRIHAAITDGFGLMPSYAAELSDSDRWAVVAYIEALQLARRAPLAELPANVREEATPWLR
jgi:mono/diheme cytochrome c family protein